MLNKQETVWKPINLICYKKGKKPRLCKWKEKKACQIIMLSFLAKRTSATLPGFLLTGIQELNNL